jgi:regulator of protease activity HflC (stomatin/prohibitin superfamily)
MIKLIITTILLSLFIISNAQSAIVEVFDQFGRKLCQGLVASGAVSLDFTGQLTAGIYLIKLHGTDIPVQTGKLIIEH